MGNFISLKRNQKIDVKTVLQKIHESETDETSDESSDNSSEYQDKQTIPRYDPNFVYNETEGDDDEELIRKQYEQRLESREAEREPLDEDDNFMEEHISYSKIDKNEYLRIISLELEKPDSFYNSLDLAVYIKTKFLDYIKEQLDPKESQNLEIKMNQILDKLFESESFNRRINELRIIIGKTIDFVFQQDNEFISTYIITFIYDNYFAYNNEIEGDKSINISCSEGIIERFITVIGSVLEILCITKAECTNQLYIDLYKIINKPIDLNDFTQKWASEHLNTEYIQNMTASQRKQHFIEFITDEYYKQKVEQLNKNDLRNITQYANDLDAAGIFVRGEFGGYAKKNGNTKKNNKKNNKKNTKKKIKKNSKKNIKKNSKKNSKKNKKY